MKMHAQMKHTLGDHCTVQVTYKQCTQNFLYFTYFFIKFSSLLIARSMGAGHLANWRATNSSQLCQGTVFLLETLKLFGSRHSLEKSVFVQFAKKPASSQTFVQ